MEHEDEMKQGATSVAKSLLRALFTPPKDLGFEVAQSTYNMIHQKPQNGRIQLEVFPRRLEYVSDMINLTAQIRQSAAELEMQEDIALQQWGEESEQYSESVLDAGESWNKLNQAVYGTSGNRARSFLRRFPTDARNLQAKLFANIQSGFSKDDKAVTILDVDEETLEQLIIAEEIAFNFMQQSDKAISPFLQLAATSFHQTLPLSLAVLRNPERYDELKERVDPDLGVVESTSPDENIAAYFAITAPRVESVTLNVSLPLQAVPEYLSRIRAVSTSVPVGATISGTRNGEDYMISFEELPDETPKIYVFKSSDQRFGFIANDRGALSEYALRLREFLDAQLNRPSTPDIERSIVPIGTPAIGPNGRASIVHTLEHLYSTNPAKYEPLIFEIVTDPVEEFGLGDTVNVRTVKFPVTGLPMLDIDPAIITEVHPFYYGTEKTDGRIAKAHRELFEAKKDFRRSWGLEFKDTREREVMQRAKLGQIIYAELMQHHQ